LEQLANFLEQHGQREEAEKLNRQLLEAQRKLSPPDHLNIASRLVVLGSLVSDAGRPAEGEPLLREGLTIRDKNLAPGHWQTAFAGSLRGGCLIRQKKFAEAEPLLLAGYESLAKGTGAPARRVAEALDRVIELYEKWGKPEQAKAWRKKRLAFAPRSSP